MSEQGEMIVQSLKKEQETNMGPSSLELDEGAVTNMGS